MSDEDLKSSAFLNLVVENIPAMLAVKDAADYRFVLLNRAGEELTGISRTESIGKSDHDFFPKEQAEFFIARDREVLESGRLQIIPEETINTRHKGVRVLRTLKMPVPDETGRPKYLLALSVDITDQKEAEAALRASEAMFRGLLAASPDGVIVFDHGGRILLASQRIEAMFGYTSDELVGSRFDVLVPPQERDAYASHLRQYATDPAYPVASRDFTGLRKGGAEFPTEVSFSPNGTGGAIAAIRDITERRSVEMQLRQSQKMEAIGNLTGGMAHDFNNLLAIVIGNLDLLASSPKSDAEVKQLGGEALEAALRGADLTQRLLAFARRQPLRAQRIDINQQITNIAKLLRRTLSADISVSLDLNPATWPVTIDPAQFDSSLTNLANNARDAMPTGGNLNVATGNLYLDADYAALHPEVTPGEYAMIEVSDTGSGMTSEVTSRIFEPFFSTKEKDKGTGLGLSMVFGFIKQSGGHISVYSEPGLGTAFRLFFPRAPAEEGQVATEAPSPVVRRAEGEKILVVEDDAALRRVVVRQLTELGYQVTEAEDASSALKILEAEPVDLLFTDVVMPGGWSGYDLTEMALKRWPSLKVLMTSGFPDAMQSAIGGSNEGGPRLLSKPYRRDDLARILREVLV